MSASRMYPQTPPPPGLPDGPLAPNPYPYPWGGALPYPAPVAGYGVFISHRKGLRSVRRDFGWDFRWVDPLIGFGVGIVTIIISGIVRVIVAQAFSEPAGSNAERIFGSAENNHVALVILAMM